MAFAYSCRSTSRRPGDGYEPQEYGLEALLHALEMAAPAGLVAALKDANAKAGDTLASEAHPHIVGYATAAAAADTVPVAGAVAVPVVQSKMLHSLARIYGVDWNRKALDRIRSLPWHRSRFPACGWFRLARACEAHSRLWPDGGSRRSRRDEFRDHFRHRQGGLLLPRHPSGGRERSEGRAQKLTPMRWRKPSVSVKSAQGAPA